MADKSTTEKPRDYSAMWDHGTCIICAEPEHCERVLHMREHLADGTAVVVKAFGKPDRVLPTSTQPVKDTADDPNPPKLKQKNPNPKKPLSIPWNAKSFYGKSFRGTP